jgi:hypothetical protein
VPDNPTAFGKLKKHKNKGYKKIKIIFGGCLPCRISFFLVALLCGPAPKRYTGVTRHQLARCAMPWRRHCRGRLHDPFDAGHHDAPDFSASFRDVLRPRRLRERQWNHRTGDSKHDPGLGSSCMPRPAAPLARCLHVACHTHATVHAHGRSQRPPSGVADVVEPRDGQ